MSRSARVFTLNPMAGQLPTKLPGGASPGEDQPTQSMPTALTQLPEGSSPIEELNTPKSGVGNDGGFGRYDTHMGMLILPSDSQSGNLKDAFPAIPDSSKSAGSSRSVRLDEIPDAARRRYLMGRVEEKRRALIVKKRAQEGAKETEQVRVQPQVGDKRSHSTSNSSPFLMVPSAMQDQIDVEQSKDIALRKIKPPKAVRCAIQVGEGPVIGSLSGPQLGIGFYFVIDGGLSGGPSICLKVKVPKNKRDQDIFKLNSQEIDETKILWYPGQQRGNKYMLHMFESVKVSEHMMDIKIASEEVVRDIKETQLHHLTCVRFQANYPQHPPLRHNV